MDNLTPPSITGDPRPPAGTPGMPPSLSSVNPFGASFNMSGVEQPPPNIPSMFKGMVSGPTFPTPPGSPAPSGETPTPGPTAPGPVAPAPTPASPAPVPTPPPATPTASPTTPPPGTPSAGSSPFFVSGLGKVPSLNDFLQYMSYSSPREQGLKNILEDKGIFDKFSPYLQPGSTPGSWATGELGAYGPSHNLNKATSPFATGGSGTPFDGYNPEGLMQLLSDSGIVTGYSPTPGTTPPGTPGTPAPGTPPPGGGPGGIGTVPGVAPIVEAGQQLRDWDWSKGLPPALQPGNPLGKAMGWDNTPSMPTQNSGWSGSHPIFDQFPGVTPSPQPNDQPGPSPAPTEPAPGALGESAAALGGGPPPANQPGELSGALGAIPPIPEAVIPGTTIPPYSGPPIPEAAQPNPAQNPFNGRNPDPYGTGIPQPQKIEDPNNAAYGADHQLTLEDMGTPAFEQGATPQDRQYLAGLSYYFNPTNYQAWQNALNWGVPGVPTAFNPTPGGAAPQGMQPGGGNFIA